MSEIEALQRALTVACNDVANTIGEILTILDELPADARADRTEQFRKALMVEHAHDWDMDTISEAAHICARASGGVT